MRSTSASGARATTTRASSGWAAMSGTVTLALDPPAVRKELERNPSGVYVVDFSFSREAA
jgi:type IV secretory pathway TrbF-like protein